MSSNYLQQRKNLLLTIKFIWSGSWGCRMAQHTLEQETQKALL